MSLFGEPIWCPILRIEFLQKWGRAGLSDFVATTVSLALLRIRTNGGSLCGVKMGIHTWTFRRKAGRIARLQFRRRLRTARRLPIRSLSWHSKRLTGQILPSDPGWFASPQPSCRGSNESCPSFRKSIKRHRNSWNTSTRSRTQASALGVGHKF